MTKRPLLLLAIAVFLLHALVTGGHLTSPDEELMYRMAEGMALRGTTQVVPLEANLATGELPRGLPPELTFATRPGRDPGVFYAQYLPLQPLLSVPIVWLAKASESVAAPVWSSWMWPTSAEGYLTDLDPAARAAGQWRRGLLVLLFNPLVAALSAVLLCRLGTLLTGNRKAGLFAAVAWAFGTIGWAHSKTYFTEPLAGLFFLAALDQVIRWHRKPLGEGWLHAAGVGVALALANLTRVDAPFFTVGIVGVMGVAALWRHFEAESWARPARTLPVVDLFLAGGIAFAGWVALQSFNTIRFGQDLTSGYGNQVEGVQFTTPLLVGLHGLTMSPGKGLFFFSPALLLGLWGLWRWRRRLRWEIAYVCAGLLPFTLAMIKWQNWDGGWCWGPRHIVQIHLPLMLGAALLWADGPALGRRAIMWGLLAVGAVVQIFGTSQAPMDYYREFFTTFGDLTYHRVNLRGLQESEMQREFALFYRERDGKLGGEISPSAIPAPLIDSLYLPQHSQWYSYPVMWQMGYCDWLVLNAIRGAQNPDRWTED
ncbi:phospholipid carrier-dependent glycosyltransferase [bacterium]|nr:phospholipid carrier-dependent glycosyltransferase [bacterium]